MQHSLAMRSMLAGAIGLTLSFPLFAQSTTLDFTNSSLDPIPLLDGTAVVIDGNGNVQAQCELDGDSCLGVSGGVNAPTVSLTTTSNTTISGSGSVALNWTSTNTPEVCLARATNGYTGWTGIKPATGSGSFSFSTTGVYGLSLECYNDNGSGTSQAINVTVEKGQGPVDECDITSTDPLFQPAAFDRRIVEWPNAFFGNQFPVIGNGGLAPVGSFTFANHSSSSPGSGLPIAGKYISIPFVPSAGGAYKIEWYGAQTVSVRKYSAKPASATYVTLSKCAGDFRLIDFGATAGTTLSRDCRVFSRDGSINYGTNSKCKLEAGVTYYFNVLHADPYDGDLTTTENTCTLSPTYCDANFNN